MNCSILDLTLFQQGHVYAPEDLGRQDILVSRQQNVAIAPSISPDDFPAVSVSILPARLCAQDLSIQTRPLIGGAGEAGAAYPHAGSALVTPG